MEVEQETTCQAEMDYNAVEEDPLNICKVEIKEEPQKEHKQDIFDYVVLKKTTKKTEIEQGKHKLTPCKKRQTNPRDHEAATKMSTEQKEVMVAFMEDNPDFAKGKLLGHHVKEIRTGMWEVLSTQLNSISGPKKTSQKWQRVWIDLKNKVKKKASTIKSSLAQTGGGPPLKVVLTDVELKIVSIMGDAAVYGMESSHTDPPDSEDVNQPPEKLLVHRASTSTTTTDLSELEDVGFEEHSYTKLPGKEEKFSQELLPQAQQPQELLPQPQQLQELLPQPQQPQQFLPQQRVVVQEKVTAKRRLSNSSASTSCDEASCDEAARRAGKKMKVESAMSALQAAAKFAEIGEGLNNRMDSISQKLDSLIESKRQSNAKLDLLVETRKETNTILKSIAAALENLKK
ncbi:uncharacterized protein LOC126882661 isoform X2 [Diabrotica virgifera virgifera]|uniref:Regulatory protein zeste n=1 Tax=Diabrotica virgifera virgifera TaxID=50390 RepID=A0ABM5K088_DIAVI|nr:uncharacterized protein LOC126882661 isoform X2 [Diabrotica virgifera virgifera]